MKNQAIEAVNDTYILYYTKENLPKWYKAKKGQIVGYIGTQTPETAYFPMADGTKISHWKFVKSDTRTGTEKEYEVQYIRTQDAKLSQKGYVQTDFTGKKVFALNKEITTNIYSDWLKTAILDSFKISALSDGFLGRLTGVVYTYPYVIFEIKYGNNLEKIGYLEQPINFNSLSGIIGTESFLDKVATTTKTIQDVDTSIQKKTEDIEGFFSKTKNLAMLGIALAVIYFIANKK